MNYFNEIAEKVISSAINEKAAAFAEKVVGQIKEKGEDWIEKNSQALEVDFLPGDTFPVEDNRFFYMQKWQLAIAEAE